ncbi:MAG: acyltransferase [Microbacteriaceae bacterium]|nr:acyltransferase [Microbacteriaceae bacterium]
MSGTTSLPAAAGTPAIADPPATGPARDYFRTDVEGLRAIACGAVVAFHAALPGFAGGFVGVDIFFVISGFLITGLMLREHQRTGRISFKSFYARRARRIVPAAALVLVVTAVAALLMQPILAAFNTTKSVLASAVFFSNWHFIDLGTDYFTESAAESPVLHYWSLAVEEQFYFVWPALVVLGFFLAGRLRVPSIHIVAGVLLLVTVASIVLSALQTETDPAVAYMSTFTRAWQFGIGGLLAVVAPWIESHAGSLGVRLAGIAVGWIGLALVVVSIVTYSEQMAFPGTLALLPTLGTAAIIASGCVLHATGKSVGRVLALRPLRFIGKVSFAWYLWHWPVLVLAEGVLGPLPIRWKVVLAAFSFFLAVLTLLVLEQPISRWKELGRRASAGIAVGVLSVVAAVTTALLVGQTAVARVTSGDLTATLDETSIQQVFGPDTGAHAGPVTPDPIAAVQDAPLPEECLLTEETDRVMACQTGVIGGAPIVLLGDSHMHQWLPAFQELAEQRDWELNVYTRAGCPVADIAPRPDDSRFSQPYCTQWRQDALAEIQAMQPNLVFVSQLHTYVPDQTEMLDAWTKSLDALRTTGAPIVYLRDTPHPVEDVPTCVSAAIDDWDACKFAHDGMAEPVVPEALTGAQPGITVVDLIPYFCTDQQNCAVVRNGLLLFRDDSHITATAARAFVPVLEDTLETSGLIPVR